MDQEALPPRVGPHPIQPASDGETLRDLVRLLGGDLSGLDADAGIPIAVRRMAAGASLAHEGARLHSLYVLRCGSLKFVRTLEDGYEQVTCLAMPGDVLALDGIHSGRHAATAVALELSTVYALPLADLQALRHRCGELDAVWQRATSRQMARALATADMLSAVASDVRLARFLLWLSARVTELGQSPLRLRLSLCRRDLASLLGVAHETVSRSFTSMAEAGLLKVDNREIEILDLEQLRGRAGITRRPIEPVRNLELVQPKPVTPPRLAAARWAGLHQAQAGR